MQLDAGETIADVGALVLRDFLRAQDMRFWHENSLASRLRVSSSRANEVIKALLERGYLRTACVDPAEPLTPWYTITQPGRQFALATGARPLTRKTAERALAAFMERVARVNAGRDGFAFRVSKVVLFGSYLTDAERLGDVDLAVDVAPWSRDVNEHDARCDARIELALAAGRRFANMVDEAYWPQAEVLQFLKSRSRALSVHEIADERVYGDRCRVLYDMTTGATQDPSEGL